MTLEQLIQDAQSYRHYRQAKRESLDDYALRLASIIHRGWSFCNKDQAAARAWFEGEVQAIKALLTPVS